MVIDPEARDIYNVLGLTYSELGRHDEAMAMHQRYVALAPNEPNAYDSLGMSYQWAGQYEQALEAYNQALDLDPEFEVAAFHLGNVHFQQVRYRGATRQYQRFLHIAPSHAERVLAYSPMAWVYWKKGDLDRAEAAAKMEMRYERWSSWIPHLIALERGDLIATDRLKEQLFAPSDTGRGQRPWLRYNYWTLGALALRSEHPSEAIKNFKEVLRHRPIPWDIDSIEDCLANAYPELGQLDEAIVEYERILKLNPRYRLAHYHLGLAYQRQGQPAGAAYEQFLRVWKDADPNIPELIDANNRLANLR